MSCVEEEEAEGEVVVFSMMGSGGPSAVEDVASPLSLGRPLHDALATRGDENTDEDVDEKEEEEAPCGGGSRALRAEEEDPNPSRWVL